MQQSRVTLLYVKESTGGCLFLHWLLMLMHACVHLHMCACSHTHTCSHVHLIAAIPYCRVGTYAGHSGRIIQLLSLGDVLLSLGADRKLLVWGANTYDAPTVVAIELHAAGCRHIPDSSFTFILMHPTCCLGCNSTCTQCSPHGAMTCTLVVLLPMALQCCLHVFVQHVIHDSVLKLVICHVCAFLRCGCLRCSVKATAS